MTGYQPRHTPTRAPASQMDQDLRRDRSGTEESAGLCKTLFPGVERLLWAEEMLSAPSAPAHYETARCHTGGARCDGWPHQKQKLEVKSRSRGQNEKQRSSMRRIAAHLYSKAAQALLSTGSGKCGGSALITPTASRQTDVQSCKDAHLVERIRGVADQLPDSNLWQKEGLSDLCFNRNDAGSMVACQDNSYSPTFQHILISNPTKTEQENRSRTTNQLAVSYKIRTRLCRLTRRLSERRFSTQHYRAAKEPLSLDT